MMNMAPISTSSASLGNHSALIYLGQIEFHYCREEETKCSDPETRKLSFFSMLQSATTRIKGCGADKGTSRFTRL